MLELLAKVRISERKSKLVFEFSQRTKVPEDATQRADK